MMAEDLGKRLLAEVEVVGVGEILKALRLQGDASTSTPPFGFPPLDRLLQAANEGLPHASNRQVVLELASLHAGGGATHLLYHFIAIATLPSDRAGRQSCAVILDTDGQFNVERLVFQMRAIINKDSVPDSVDTADDIIVQALRHVLVFRPQSLASLSSTLDSLPAYLFNQQRHFSFDRAVGLIAIDSASAFYWQDRGETEDAAFYAKTSGEPGATAPQTGYVALIAALKNACTALQCPAMFTSWHLSPTSTTPHTSRSFRPSLPAPFSALPTLRLACQRIPVKKFPPLISVEGATREADDRLKAVEEGRFECFVNEWGVDERTLRRMHGVGSGFEFKIQEDCVVIEGRM